MKKHLSDRGFSLVELIVTIMIMAIIAGGLTVSISTVYNADAERAAENLCSMMQLARTKAMALSDDTGDSKVEVALDISAKDDAYYATVYSRVVSGGAIVSTEPIKEQKLGNYRMKISIGNIGQRGVKYSDFALPSGYEDEVNNERSSNPNAVVYTDLMNIEAAGGTSKNGMAVARYVFYKDNGAIKEAGTSSLGNTFGSTNPSQYYDIYVESSKLEHIIIVKETGRCYLYEE